MDTIGERLPVVVGVDGMAATSHSVDLAAAEAVRRGVPLAVVHAWPGRPVRPSRTRAVMPARAEGRHLLELAARRARHAYPDLEIVTELADQGAAQALLRWSARASLLVVGHRDETRSRYGWGPTAAYLAHHTECPLLVHRGPAPSRGPVAVALSGARTPTLAMACGEAARAGCSLVAVHVRTKRGDQRFAERLTADVPVQRLLISGADIPYTVDRISWRARLMVAGIGHKGWAVETVYGTPGVTSAGRRLCPVLLVPPNVKALAGKSAASK
ncbi:universal stress protein [Actinoplanes missouriensis]|uniref:universal stress protein n=1 Tax=Actinoplanes missouriensis TaxID=1866 RepID=UPI00368520C0